MEPPSALGHRPWSTRAATACPVQVWGWPLGCPWSARRRRARGQGACCFRVASSRRCDDECSSASGRERRQRLSTAAPKQSPHGPGAHRPASQLSPGITETSAAARCIGKGAAKIVQKLICRACNQTIKLPKNEPPARLRRSERLDIASATTSRFLRRGATPEGC